MSTRPAPCDEALSSVLEQVRLEQLLERRRSTTDASEAAEPSGLDRLADWGGILSLGEQQRLAFAR